MSNGSTLGIEDKSYFVGCFSVKAGVPADG